MFPFVDPDWADRFEWMSFDTRTALGVLAFVWDILVIMGLIGGTLALFLFGHWKFAVGFWVGIVLILFGKFLWKIYKEYRRHNPRRVIPVVERKKQFFRFSL